MKKLTILAVLICLLMVQPAAAATRHVPSQYPDIQSAVNASSGGDEVVVAPGTHTGPGNRDINPGGRSIVIRSSGGAASTILDLQQQGRGFTLNGGESPAMRIEGFTLRNGRETMAGAGIAFWGSSATVRNCRFENCVVTGTGGEGGGIRVASYSNPTIEDCSFSACSASFGGGVHVITYCNPVIQRCTFSSCVGAGIYCWDTVNIQIRRCQLRSCTDSTLSYSAGIAVYSSSNATIDNCYLTGGSMSAGGAGVATDQSQATIRHCTIVNNTAGGAAGGVMIKNGAASLLNCILWGNTGNQIGTLSGTVTVQYSCVQGGYAGTGNFADSPGLSGGDYHLPVGSSCIDRGTSCPVTDDLEGDTRPQGSGHDVGCDETSGGPAATIDAFLTMPAHHFSPGSDCWLDLDLSNSGPTASGMPVFVLLEAFGAYYFWPSWGTGLDYQTQSVPTGPSVQTILPHFSWPPGTGSASGLRFLAAVTDPGMSYLKGTLGTWDFSFSD